MGSLDNKINPTPSNLGVEHVIASNANELRVNHATYVDRDYPLGLESEHAITNDAELLVLEPVDTTAKDANKLIGAKPPDQDDQDDSDKRFLRFASCTSSISSPDSTLEDPFNESDSELEKLKDGATDQLARQHSDNAKEQLSDSEIPISTPGPAAMDHTSETPPIQVMERQTTPQKYRIPSSVFARKKSTAPEWSLNSNESLFSIQMGGMSFCNQDSMFWKSGELGLGYGAEPSTNFPYDHQYAGGKATETGKALELDKTEKTHELGEAGKGHELGTAGDIHKADEAGTHKVGEASYENHEADKFQGKVPNNHEINMLDDSMASAFRDSRDDQGSKKSITEERISHHSVESGGSTKSFAFPILAGEGEKGHSARIGGSLKGIPEKQKVEPQSETQPEPETEKEPQKEQSEEKADTPAAAAPAAAWTSWFPCFRCCTFCS